MERKQLQELMHRRKELETERQSWKQDWRELSQYFLPRKCRFLEDGERSNEGGLRRGSLDSTGIYAMRDLAAGLHGGMTSPARPWFKLSLQNSELEGNRDVRLWLDEVEKRMRDILHRSNFYNAVHQVYEELAAFGTAFMFEMPDKRTGVRFHTMTVGEYCLDADEHGRVDTVFRAMDMTLRQLVRKFTLEKLPEPLRHMWEHQRNWGERFTVVHAVYPRDDRNPDKIDGKNKPWASVYYLESQAGGKGAGGGIYPHLLSEGGYDEFPGFGVRWDVTGGDVYGRSPGMDTLPDCVLLQSMTISMLKALHKEVDPPMVVAGQHKGVNTFPGGVTFTDPTQGQGQGVYPALQLRHNIQGTAAATRMETFDRDMNDALEDFNNVQLTPGTLLDAITPRKLKEFERWMKKTAFTPTSVMQFGVDLPTWLGAYDKGMKDFDGNHDKAKDYADYIVRITQGSGEAIDLAKIQRGS